jgi:hypothetical protein
MNILWLSWILAIFSLIGMWNVGKYRLWAWAYLGVLEILWTVYGILTEQYGFILLTIGYIMIYTINYKRWKQNQKEML